MESQNPEAEQRERDYKSLNEAFYYRKEEKPIVFHGGHTYNQANSIKYINRTK